MCLFSPIKEIQTFPIKNAIVFWDHSSQVFMVDFIISRSCFTASSRIMLK